MDIYCELSWIVAIYREQKTHHITIGRDRGSNGEAVVCYISSSVMAKRREDIEVAGMEYLWYVSHMQTAQDFFLFG